MRINFLPSVLLFFSVIYVITQLCVVLCQGDSLNVLQFKRAEIQNATKSIEGGGFILPKNSKHINRSSTSISDRYGHGKEYKIYKVGTEGLESSNNDELSNEFVFDNTFGRYGGGIALFGKSRSIELFSDANRRWKSFSIRDGAGFAGRAESGIALMEALHLYKQYKAMVMYKEYAHYDGYDGSGIYQQRNCPGGCPSRTFCDSGICRCFFGKFHYLGTCVKDEIEYNKREVVALKQGSGEVQLRKASKFNPHAPCTDTSNCQEIDINLICSSMHKTCECREDTKWNEVELQCQVYMDIYCSIFQDSKNTDLNNDIYGMFYSEILSNTSNKENIYTSDASLSSPENKSLQNILNPKWNGCVDDPKKAKEAGFDPNYFTHKIYQINNIKQDEIDKINESKDCPDITLGFNINYKTGDSYDCRHDEYQLYCPRKCNACLKKWMAEHGNLDIHGITIPNYQLSETEDGNIILNMTTLSPEDTLSASNLVQLQLDKTTPIKIKKQFCAEIKALTIKYSEPERMYQMEKKVKQSKKLNENNQERDKTGDYFTWLNLFDIPVSFLIGLAFVLACFFCVCCIVCFCKSKSEDIEDINRIQRLRENPNLFGQHPSQININSPQTSFSRVPLSTSESPPTSNYLAYPNSGTSYQAPCTNPL